MSPVKKTTGLALPGRVVPTQLRGGEVADAARKSVSSVPAAVIFGSQASAVVKTAFPAAKPLALPTGGAPAGIALVPAVDNTAADPSTAVSVPADEIEAAGSPPASPAARPAKQVKKASSASDGEFKYRCRIVHKRDGGCDRPFASSASLRNHMERIHQLWDTVPAAQCAVCKRRFTSPSDYKKHWDKDTFCDPEGPETAFWVKPGDPDYPVTDQDKADTWCTAKYGRLSRTVEVRNSHFTGVRKASPQSTPVIDLTADDQTAVQGQHVVVAGPSTSPVAGIKRKRTAIPDEMEQQHVVQSQIRLQQQQQFPRQQLTSQTQYVGYQPVQQPAVQLGYQQQYYPQSDYQTMVLQRQQYKAALMQQALHEQAMAQAYFAGLLHQQQPQQLLGYYPPPQQAHQYSAVMPQPAFQPTQVQPAPSWPQQYPYLPYPPQ